VVGRGQFVDGKGKRELQMTVGKLSNAAFQATV
jgi:hypothetical protein